MKFKGNNRRTFYCYATIIILIACSFTNLKASAQPVAAGYPKITGYVGILHPLVTFTKGDNPHYNFDGSYVTGMPAGINIWKSPLIGFSLEFVPLIRASNGTSKMNNFLFHPGALFGLGNGYTLATRAAFETSGRYGFTPVLNKIIKKNTGCSYFVALPVPVRFGNDLPASLTAGFQFGISF